MVWNLSVEFIHHLLYFIFQLIKKLCPALLPIPDFQEDTIKVSNLDIEKYLATKSDVFQTGISIIKAFARIDRIDEFNQGDFTIRPLQQLTVYYGGEFKMQFVWQRIDLARYIFYLMTIRQNHCNAWIMLGGKRRVPVQQMTINIGKNIIIRTDKIVVIKFSLTGTIIIIEAIIQKWLLYIFQLHL